MLNEPKTVIVTGASQGIGAALVKTFLERGYSVVATSRNMTESGAFVPSDKLALVDGDIGEYATAAKIADAATSKFRSIDALINNAGIFFTKPFINYTAEDFKALASTNLEGFIYITQLAIKQMVTQKSGGSIVNITTTLVEHPIAGVNASVPMITKGGIEAITRSLAMEYAKDGIRVNAVAPGVVDTPMHKNDPKDSLKSLSPLGRSSGCSGYRRRRALSHRGPPGNGRGAPRRWRRTCGQMVTGEGSRPARAEQRLKELGIKLPAPPEPFGTYVEAVQTGNLLFLSGMLPTEGRGAKFIGRVGAELDVEAGRKAAHLAALNVLAVAQAAFGIARQSDADRPARRVSGHVGRCPRSAESRRRPGVLQDVFGKDGNCCWVGVGFPLGTRSSWKSSSRSNRYDARSIT